MINNEGVKRFTELREKINAKLSEDRVDFEVSIEQFYNEFRILVRKFSNPDLHLPHFEKFKKENASYNNHTKLKALADFIEPLIVEQSIETEKSITQSKLLNRDKTKHETGISKLNDVQFRLRKLQGDFRSLSHEDYLVELRSFYNELSVLIKNYCPEQGFFESRLNSLIVGNQKQTKDLQLVDSLLLTQSIIADLEIQQEKYENRVSDLETENKIFMEASDKLERQYDLLLTELGKKEGSITPTGKPYSQYVAHILFFILMTYVNFSFDKVFGIYYGNDVRFSLEILLVIVLILSFFKSIPERIKIIIDVCIAVLIPLILNYFKR